MKKYFFIIIVFCIFMGRIYYINSYENVKYKTLLNNKTNNYVNGPSAPRGRILDRNGKVLVDNIGIKTVFYTKLKGISRKDEINIARELASLIDIEINNNSLKQFWLVTHNNGDDLITEEEWQLYNERKLSSQDLKKYKYERVTTEDLNAMDELEKKSATIYDLMNKGYSYEKKIIVRDISDEEYGNLIAENIKGITTGLTWERIYNYGDTLKDIFGTIGNIPEEEKDNYLKKGYELNDIVGLSYLELEYEDYLKGEKDQYKVNKDNTLELLKEGKRGNDLVLSIDIDRQY